MLKMIFLSGFILLVAVGCGSNSSSNGTSQTSDSNTSQEKQYVLKLSNDATEANAKVKAVQKWAELANEKSNGRLKIEVYHSAQLYNDPDAIQAISIGNVDIALPPANLLTSVNPNWGVFELPSLFGINYDQYRQLVTGELGQKLASETEKKLNVKVLGYYHMGNWMWASNKKMIESPADFKGQKIRIIGGQLQESFMKEFNAGPTQIAWPEVYTALQQGVIDGLETTMSGANQIKGWEVMKYVAYSKHKQLPYTMMINRASWEKLPADLQQILQDTFNESQVYQDDQINQVDTKGADTFRENGSEVVELTPEQLDAFRQKVLPLENGLVKDLKIDPALVKLAKDSLN